MVGGDVEGGAVGAGQPGRGGGRDVVVGGVVEHERVEQRRSRHGGDGHRAAGEVRTADRGGVEIDVAGEVLGHHVVGVTRLNHDRERHPDRVLAGTVTNVT